LAAEAKKFSTGQQPQHASPWLRIAPATTTAELGDHSADPSGATRARISSPLTGSRDSISIASPNIGAIPSASIAHIASTSCPSGKRTRCAVGLPEKG
jgi:hypothetical protein